MDADLYIHILEGIKEEDVIVFRSAGYRAIDDPVRESPAVWIGEFPSDDFSIGDPVIEIQALIGKDFPILDDELSKQILDHLPLIAGNNDMGITGRTRVAKFLSSRFGQKIFAMVW